MLEIQKYLKSNTIESLTKHPYNLHVSSTKDLILFKYNQIESDFSLQIVQESRGIILDKTTFEIICNPFFKFWNLGETHAYNNINLKNSIIMEKSDGSIIKVYFYKNEWHIATNGTINAVDAEISNTNFFQLFIDVIPNYKELFTNFDKKNTYIFELIHPVSQIVVDYKNKKELVLIGIRSNDINNMIDYNIFHNSIKLKYEKIFLNFPIRFPKIYTFNNDISELSNYADKINKSGNEFEGFVVTEINDYKVTGRVKIKSSQYLILHRLCTGDKVETNLVDVLLNGNTDEFEVYINKFPVNTSIQYFKLKQSFNEFYRYISDSYEIYKDMANKISRKELALNVISHNKNISSFIFTLIDYPNTTIMDVLKKLGSKKLKEILLNRIK